MKSYNIKIYQLCINIANCGDLIGELTTPDGDTLTPEVHKGNWLPSYEGSHIAYDGTLEFTLKNVVRFLSGHCRLGRICKSVVPFYNRSHLAEIK